jgi:hypothetical protein
MPSITQSASHLQQKGLNVAKNSFAENFTDDPFANAPVKQA